MNQYTIHDIQLQIQNNIEVLISPWMTNRAEGYTLDSATKNLLALGFWLDAELHKLQNIIACLERTIFGKLP